jgi:hypothetical protein
MTRGYYMGARKMKQGWCHTCTTHHIANLHSEYVGS